MYRLATIHNVADRQTQTDRQTDDSITTIADQTACNSMVDKNAETTKKPYIPYTVHPMKLAMIKKLVENSTHIYMRG